MKRNLVAYGDRGFAIVGINKDRTLKACQACVEKEEIRWPNLMGVEEGSGWQNPMATQYGITGIPSAILVDQNGKSLDAACSWRRTRSFASTEPGTGPEV
jgi:hypothetical protein